MDPVLAISPLNASTHTESSKTIEQTNQSADTGLERFQQLMQQPTGSTSSIAFNPIPTDATAASSMPPATEISQAPTSLGDKVLYSIENFQGNLANTGQLIAHHKNAGSAIPIPELMSIQYSILKATTEIQIYSKIAGGLSNDVQTLFKSQ